VGLSDKSGSRGASTYDSVSGGAATGDRRDNTLTVPEASRTVPASKDRRNIIAPWVESHPTYPYCTSLAPSRPPLRHAAAVLTLVTIRPVHPTQT
jgi:hypothetical protein